MESRTINLRAAIAAAMAKPPNTTTFSQCQALRGMERLFFLTFKYMWFARTNVRGYVLRAPVRLMKSPIKGSRAATKVLTVR